MAHLFIDSTYELTVGVLSEELNWLSFQKIQGTKASAVIQQTAYDLLKQHSLEFKDVKSIISIYGPGFYTGLRLAEGFADVFKFFGTKTYSFYSYEIPRFCGQLSGVWFTKAYRGEYFLYNWNTETSSQKLVATNELKDAITNQQFFVHSEASLDQISRELIKNPIHTQDLLKEHPIEIFSEVLKGLQREPFYFRAPEDEFKVNP